MQANTSSGWEYQIRIEGKISQRWLAWFEGLAITTTEEDPRLAGRVPAMTTLTGLVADQAALAGLLQKIYTLGLPLLEVRRKETAFMGSAAGDEGEMRAQSVNSGSDDEWRKGGYEQDV